MDRPYATAEQFERWFKKTCARCGQHRLVQARWPDGPVCWTCHDRALQIRGHCPRCGENRVLPGLAPDGTSLCTTCSGFRMSYACSRCGHEGKLHASKLCTRCTFADRLTELLDDGSGQIRPEMLPLFEALVGMENPLTGLTWLYKPYAPRFLRGLASGEIPLTHEAFHQLRPWRPAAHLREILMSCGLLPAIDKQLLLFERWLADHLNSISETEHCSIVRQFATWHVLPRLRSQAKKQPLSPHTRRRAGAQVRRATELLNWLAAQGLTPSTCAPADLDRWHVDHRSHERHSVKGFLQWAMRSGHMSTLDIPRTENEQREPISQHRRIALLRRLITDDAPALRTRVAARFSSCSMPSPSAASFA